VKRGPVGASGWRVGAGDPAGFFRLTRRCADAEVALVLPRFASLAGTRRSRELEASVAAPRAGSGNELFGVREYRPGDSLRRIHWRSSARQGQLVVREYEPPGAQILTVGVDPSPPSLEVADQVARIAASEAWDCIRDGGRVSLWAPGVEPTPPSRDLWSVLEWLARYPYAASSADTVPLRGADVVIVLGSDNADLIDMAERSRHRRGWMVGEIDIVTDFPLERASTAWPL
jgi:uncharacterized protein (DUF58 family)